MCGGEMIFVVDLMPNTAAECNLIFSNPSNFSLKALNLIKRKSESCLVLWMKVIGWPRV